MDSPSKWLTMLVWNELVWVSNDCYAELKLFSLPTGHYRGEFYVVFGDSTRSRKRYGPKGTSITDDWEEVMVDLYQRAYYEIIDATPF